MKYWNIPYGKNIIHIGIVIHPRKLIELIKPFLKSNRSFPISFPVNVLDTNFWLLKKWKENNNFNIDNFSINDKELWNVDIEIRTWIASGKNVTFENASIALSNTNKTWEVKEYNQELEDELHSKWLDYLEWKNKVREAIKEWRIVPFFQWIRDNVRWEINKFESLVRLKEWEKVFTP